MGCDTNMRPRPSYAVSESSRRPLCAEAARRKRAEHSRCSPGSRKPIATPSRASPGTPFYKDWLQEVSAELALPSLWSIQD
jgi:hypothetical protein